MTPRSLVALSLVAALVACDRGEPAFQSSERSTPDASPAAPPPPPPRPGVAPTTFDDGSARAVTGQARAGQAPGAVPDAPARRLIRSGRMTVRVDQVEPAIERLRAIAAGLDGYVGDVSISTGHEQIRHATAHLRFPADRFDDAIDAIRPLGTVEELSVSAQDVTEQHADLDTRLTNARRLEQRILTVLDTRTGDLQQVLAAERELARVRTEIEMLEGRLRQLADRVEMSTLMVHVREPRAVLAGGPGRSVLGDAFREAGRNFVRTVAGLIALAGAVAPVLLLVALALAPAVVWWRRRGGARGRVPTRDPSGH